jgi:hypothetical protein
MTTVPAVSTLWTWNTVQDPAVVRTLLTHVGRALSTEAPGPAPPAPAAIG